MSRPLTVLFSLLLTCSASAQMPDVSQMSGVPLPTGDLPTGTVSVRVVRGDLSNNVVNQLVELHGGSQVQRATTGDDGRALFSNQPPGSTLHAVTTVDGQRLVTQTFVLPSAGGVRVILVAGAGSQAPAPTGENRGSLPPDHPSVGAAQPPSTATGPPQAGTVVLGGQTRFVVELADDALDLYYLLEVVNAAQHPVTATPIVFELPAEARGLTVMEGSSPQAGAEGHRVKVTGPFKPGVTSVQFAYQLPYASGTVRLRQRIPVALSQTSVIVRKLGDMHFSSPQAGSHREMTTDGNTYIVGSGAALAPGDELEIEVTGLPHHSPWPRYAALLLAGGIAVGGFWLSIGGAREQAEARRKKLEVRREQLLSDLVRLEEQHLTGRADESRYPLRRASLLEQLDQVYAELENAGTVLDESPIEPAVTRARVTA